MIASKCQGGLAPNSHIPFRFQGEILTAFVFWGFWGVWFGYFLGRFSALFLHAAYFPGCIHRITVVYCIQGFLTLLTPYQLLSPVLFCDTFL